MAKNKKSLKILFFSFNVPKIDTGGIYYGDIGLNTKKIIFWLHDPSLLQTSTFWQRLDSKSKWTSRKKIPKPWIGNRTLAKNLQKQSLNSWTIPKFTFPSQPFIWNILLILPKNPHFKHGTYLPLSETTKYEFTYN